MMTVEEVQDAIERIHGAQAASEGWRAAYLRALEKGDAVARASHPVKGRMFGTQGMWRSAEERQDWFELLLGKEGTPAATSGLAMALYVLGDRALCRMLWESREARKEAGIKDFFCAVSGQVT